MPIVEDQSDSNDKIIDVDKLKNFLFLYKFPLILASTGFLLFIFGILVMLKTQFISSEVIFSSASPSASTKSQIQADIEGAVMAPGVYSLEEGSRITHILAAAGGLSADADRGWVAKNLNLAAKIVDGGKIFIPSQNLSDPSTSLRAGLSNSSNLLGVTADKININTASQGELENLPGVGPVTTGKIISGRPYQSPDELKSKKIVGNAVYEQIKDLITAY